MEFPSLHVYNMDTLIDNKHAELLKGKLCWHSLRVQAVQKFMVSILNESPVAHLANSVVLLCILIPLDVVLFQSGRFHIFAVVCPLDSFDTIDCVIMLLVVFCTEFCLLNFMSEIPYTICLLFALFCLSIRLSDHHGLQFAFIMFVSVCL